MQAGSGDAGGLAELHRLDFIGRDQLVELGAADADHAGSVVDANADRIRGSSRLHGAALRSEEHTSELQSLMRISYAFFCLQQKNRIDHVPLLRLHIMRTSTDARQALIEHKCKNVWIALQQI